MVTRVCQNRHRFLIIREKLGHNAFYSGKVYATTALMILVRQALLFSLGPQGKAIRKRLILRDLSPYFYPAISIVSRNKVSVLILLCKRDAHHGERFHQRRRIRSA